MTQPGKAQSQTVFQPAANQVSAGPCNLRSRRVGEGSAFLLGCRLLGASVLFPSWACMASFGLPSPGFRALGVPTPCGEKSDLAAYVQKLVHLWLFYSAAKDLSQGNDKERVQIFSCQGFNQRIVCIAVESLGTWLPSRDSHLQACDLQPVT